MTPRDLCTAGQHEGLKGAAHATAAGLLAVMALYNGVAFALRREEHLAWNCLLYVGLGAWETRQAAGHFNGRRDSSRPVGRGGS